MIHAVTNICKIWVQGNLNTKVEVLCKCYVLKRLYKRKRGLQIFISVELIFINKCK